MFNFIMSNLEEIFHFSICFGIISLFVIMLFFYRIFINMNVRIECNEKIIACLYERIIKLEARVDELRISNDTHG